MSSRSNWWFLDLFVAALYAAGAGAAIYLGFVDGPIRIALATPLVVFLPGYVLVSTVYPASADDLAEPSAGLRTPLPHQRSLDGVERLALAVAASIALVPMMWVGTDFLPGGIIFRHVLASVVAFTVLFALLGLLARWRTPPENRFAPNLGGILFSSTSNYGRSDDTGTTALFNVAVIVSLLLVASTAGFAVVNPPDTREFSELYVDIDDVDGETRTMYPDQLAAGEQQTLPVYVENHEGERTQYTVVAVLQQVENTSNGYRVQDAQVVGETTVTVESDEKKRVDVPVEPERTGDNLRLQLLLFPGDAPSNPSPSDTEYATRLWVTVGNAPNENANSDDNSGQDDQQSNDGGGDNGGDGGSDDGNDSNDGNQQTTTTQTTTTTTTTQTTTTSQTTTTTTDDGGLPARTPPSG